MKIITTFFLKKNLSKCTGIFQLDIQDLPIPINLNFNSTLSSPNFITTQLILCRSKAKKARAINANRKSDTGFHTLTSNDLDLFIQTLAKSNSINK